MVDSDSAGGYNHSSYPSQSSKANTGTISHKKQTKQNKKQKKLKICQKQ